MDIRVMVESDVEAVAALCEQFGYPASTEVVEERFRRLSRAQQHQIFVACDEHRVVGWIHVQGVVSLSSPAYAEIRGIVVDSAYRRQGIGKDLMLQAEQWAHREQYEAVRLRSGSTRPESHHFYPSLGYEQTKIQYHYQKPLP